MTIIEQLQDLHKQATTERSHYYVAKCVRDAITEITRLQHDLTDARFAAANWQTKAESPTIERCVTTLSKALQEDPGFAISWQSNIAMPILDACKNLGVPMDHATANHLADGLMLHLFGVKQAAMPEKVKASRGAQEA